MGLTDDERNLFDQLDALQSTTALSATEKLLLKADVSKPEGPSGRGARGVDRVFVPTLGGAYLKAMSHQDAQLCARYGQTPASAILHEVLAWRLIVALGDAVEDASMSKLLPPVVLRWRLSSDGQREPLALIAECPGKTRQPQIFVTARKQVRTAGFIDALLGQQDRNFGNILYGGRRQGIHIIDHAFCFARPGDLVGPAILLVVHAQRGLPRRRLRPWEREVCRIVENPHNLFGIADCLEPERLEALRRRSRNMRETGRLRDETKF